MYWPLGVPRIYAANKPSKKASDVKNDNKDAETDIEDTTSLLDLQVSRNGHLFVTITATTLTIWQTAV